MDVWLRRRRSRLARRSGRRRFFGPSFHIDAVNRTVASASPPHARQGRLKGASARIVGAITRTDGAVDAGPQQPRGEPRPHFRRLSPAVHPERRNVERLDLDRGRLSAESRDSLDVPAELVDHQPPSGSQCFPRFAQQGRGFPARHDRKGNATDDYVWSRQFGSLQNVAKFPRRSLMDNQPRILPGAENTCQRRAQFHRKECASLGEAFQCARRNAANAGSQFHGDIGLLQLRKPDHPPFKKRRAGEESPQLHRLAEELAKERSVMNPLHRPVSPDPVAQKPDTETDF